MLDIAVPGPGRELHLGDVEELDPARIPSLRLRHIEEGRCFTPVAIELGKELAPQSLAEPRPHFAGALELAFLVVADEEGAEGAAWRR